MTGATSFTLSAGDVWLLLVVVLVLWVPGGVVGTIAGLRGWTLAAAAPLLTYGVVGLAGPASSALGARWSIAALLVATAVVAMVCAALARLLPHAERNTTPWRPVAHVAVGACLAAGVLLSSVVVLRGLGTLRTIPQLWDAALHANGIRWITETGDAGVTAMTRVNLQEQYYPNAYHVLGALVEQLTGSDVPSVLNALTVATPAPFLVGVAALVCRFRGRAVHAGATVLVAAGTTGFFDMLWRGPLLPFAMGIALLPVGLVLTFNLLEGHGVRGHVRAAVPFVLGVGGLLALHPAVMVTLVVFTLPLVAMRAGAGWSRLARDVGVATAAGAATAVLYAAHIMGLVRGTGGSLYNWPATLSPAEAVGQLAMFSNKNPSPQWWLAIALLVGLITWRSLGSLRWMLAAVLIVAGLYVAAASYDSTWAEIVTQPWWNDRDRISGVAVVPLVLLAGHGIAESARFLSTRTVGVASRWVREVSAGRAAAVSATAAVLVLAALAGTTGWLYLDRNATAVSLTKEQPPTVTPGEVEGYRVLATMVAPNERVMNDRRDGSVWMYALDGVHPVAAHYNSDAIAPDAALLGERFDQYDTDPAVRAAAARLNVRWVVVGESFVQGIGPRQTGLVALDRVAALRQVWSNGVFRIYRLTPR